MCTVVAHRIALTRAHPILFMIRSENQGGYRGCARIPIYFTRVILTQLIYTRVNSLLGLNRRVATLPTSCTAFAGSQCIRVGSSRAGGLWPRKAALDANMAPSAPGVRRFQAAASWISIYAGTPQEILARLAPEKNRPTIGPDPPGAGPVGPKLGVVGARGHVWPAAAFGTGSARSQAGASVAIRQAWWRRPAAHPWRARIGGGWRSNRRTASCRRWRETSRAMREAPLPARLLCRAIGRGFAQSMVGLAPPMCAIMPCGWAAAAFDGRPSRSGTSSRHPRTAGGANETARLHRGACKARRRGRWRRGAQSARRLPDRRAGHTAAAAASNGNFKVLQQGNCSGSAMFEGQNLKAFEYRCGRMAANESFPALARRAYAASRSM